VLQFLKSLPSRPGLALGLLLAVLLLASAASYLAPSCQRKHDVRQLGAAKQASQQAQSQGEAAHTDFRLDSTKYAERAAQLRRQDSLLAHRDHEISTTRRPRLVLPALGDLPREGAN